MSKSQEQQSLQLWQREQLQAAQRYLADKGIITTKVIEKECRILPPAIAIWRLEDQKGKGYWAVSGQVPTDAVETKVANSARDALRHLSFQWQIKADGIISAGVKDQTQVDFANLLVNKAHDIYAIYNNDKLWASVAS
ncbi:DUF4826 family protein [Pseudoalteromonas luteoviolacea]|uniref:DUF4826 domain-containing protein n=1 Tax=Pseudoalteromonas luteoviolacea S4054 TaxID=1129367 RepID=A0A0F6AF35_9GAMM|nr:DUF4826 family protein [Pseudoalteromonas luteoviolacea]AOT08037.1 hypothetical protein S4054249_09350 [Pseudoalteromonas luteoviolacea]AOT12954.1 hypothetical protein S40542_09350 [Pseudoalteromonas luteoviolacea]AOT17866.1 hypothetical protein S4054_09345 [Pseudoalteromonas luteoviolacea]KKE84411.1 hypothetical protein N479_09220 [Pseudoalteromonas luteoviolacea S4054]KZN71786.1 hypothetical protein N481_17760 [Pseudoalteromonas luteoviolacea S4047-1]